MTDNNIRMPSGTKSADIDCPSDGIKDGDLILCIDLYGSFYNGAYYYNGNWNIIISSSSSFQVTPLEDGNIRVAINNDNIKRYISYITGPNH